MEERNYQKDISIDPEALDVEWLRQAELTFYYGTLLTDAREEVDNAKENLEYIKSDINLKIREKPEEYLSDNIKITEAVISSAVSTNKDIREAEKRYIDAKKEQAILQTAVSALNDKKSALEGLVKLFGQQYFAGPVEPRNLADEFNLVKHVNEKVRTKANEKVKKAVRRKRGEK